MSGEDTMVAHLVHLSVELVVEAQSQEGGVSFVHVVSADLLPQSLQCFIATDAEDCFLTDAGVTVPAVKVLGDKSVIWGVIFEICIQKIYGNL